MGTNIFEGTKFGDKFVTRSGKQVMFIFYLDDIDAYHCVCEDWYELLDYAPNGKAYTEENHPTDIVSRYREHINYAALDKEAENYCNALPYSGGFSSFYVSEAFKAGYKKAMKE